MHLDCIYFSVPDVLFPAKASINFNAFGFLCTRLYILSASFMCNQTLRMKRCLLIHNPVKRTLRKILTCIDDIFYEDEFSLPYNLPDNVKEGHFAVHAFDDHQSRRSVIELSYLAHLGFLRLLQQAEEEFGFRQKGILVVPCGYGDLQRLLQKQEGKFWMVIVCCLTLVQ